MIPPELAQCLNQAFKLLDESERQLKVIVGKMEDETPAWYAHATLLDQIGDVIGKVEDISNTAEKLTARYNRP